MRSGMRWVSKLYTVLDKVTPLEWVVAFVVAVVGLLRVLRLQTPVAGVPFWVAAGLIAAVALLARAGHYAIFVPEPLARATAPHSLPAVTSGVAVGVFTDQHGFFALLTHAAVQVRWYEKGKPPELVVLTPAELPVRGFNETEANYLSRLYPGMDVELGWLYMGGYEYPAVRIHFIGRQVCLGLESHEEVMALVHALDLDTYSA